MIVTSDLLQISLNFRNLTLDDSFNNTCSNFYKIKEMNFLSIKSLSNIGTEKAYNIIKEQ